MAVTLRLVDAIAPALFLLGLAVGIVTNRFAAVLFAVVVGAIVWAALPGSYDTPHLDLWVGTMALVLVGTGVILGVLVRRGAKEMRQGGR